MRNLSILSFPIALCLFFAFTGYSQSLRKTVQEYPDFYGSTDVNDVYSPALEGNLQGNPTTQPVKVYLPPGYYNYPDNKYPVVYLLHGYTHDYNSFYDEYGILFKLNQLISQKTIVPMIIVTPNGKNKYGGSLYTNSYVSGNWEDYIVEDVIRHIESKYRILDQKKYRGLAGHSMGGYGTAKIGMKHPSVYGSIGITSGALLDLKEILLNPPDKEYLITAEELGKYPSGFFWIDRCFAYAVAFAPDSTAKPLLGRLPYTTDGVLVDSIWQKFLKHDPFTMIQTYKDSLLKLNAIQMYIGDVDDLLPSNETFHQELLDHGIDHGYKIFSGGHTPKPVLDDLFSFFSEQLIGIVPTLHSSSDYYLENTDTLMAVTDMDGKLYLVPISAGISADSIYKYQLATANATANEEYEFELSGFEFGGYHLYAFSGDGMVSNIPIEFYVLDKSHPLSLFSDSFVTGDSIRVSSNRDCMLYFVNEHTPAELFKFRNSRFLIDSIAVAANDTVKISTTGLKVGKYWLYAVDSYGYISGPDTVTILSVGVEENVTEGIRIYPNPARELIIIKTNIAGQYSIHINSINGQLIYSTKMEGTPHEIDLSSFQKGVYFITIRSKDFVTTRKIIKL